jgi:hypothetical protein
VLQLTRTESIRCASSRNQTIVAMLKSVVITEHHPQTKSLACPSRAAIQPKMVYAILSPPLKHRTLSRAMASFLMYCFGVSRWFLAILQLGGSAFPFSWLVWERWECFKHFGWLQLAWVLMDKPQRSNLVYLLYCSDVPCLGNSDERLIQLN